MKLKDIFVTGLVVVLVVILFNRINDNNNTPEPVGDLETPIADELEEDLGVVLSDTSEKREVSSGQNRAVVAKTESGISVLADLEETDQTYQVWANGNSLGVLSPQKGGYILETSAADEISSVVISREIIVDNELEEQILEVDF